MFFRQRRGKRTADGLWPRVEEMKAQTSSRNGQASPCAQEVQPVCTRAPPDSFLRTRLSTVFGWKLCSDACVVIDPCQSKVQCRRVLVADHEVSENSSNYGRLNSYVLRRRSTDDELFDSRLIQIARALQFGTRPTWKPSRPGACGPLRHHLQNHADTVIHADVVLLANTAWRYRITTNHQSTLAEGLAREQRH